jgi:hypothetical protein
LQSVTALLPSTEEDDAGHVFCTLPAHLVEGLGLRVQGFSFRV